LVKRIDELENHYKKRIEDLERRLAYYEKFITKLGDAKDCMFTFLLHPGVPPTNNTAEQVLFESVIRRKIKGGW
jgi:hypothetical protein